MSGKTSAIKLIANPKTSPPDKNKPYIAVEVDGKERWFLLTDEASEGLTDADFKFAKSAGTKKKK